MGKVRGERKLEWEEKDMEGSNNAGRRSPTPWTKTWKSLTVWAWYTRG